MSVVRATLLNVDTLQTTVGAYEGGTITWRFERLDNGSDRAEVTFAPSDADLDFSKTYFGYDPAKPFKVVWEAGDRAPKDLIIQIPADAIDTPHRGWMTWHLTGVEQVTGTNAPDPRFVVPDGNGGFSVPVAYYDNDGPSNASIVAARPEVTEGQQKVFTFEVTREAIGFQGNVRVTVQIEGSGDHPADLSRFGLGPDPIVLDLPYWQQSQQIEINLPNDGTYQGDQTLTATIVKAVYVQGGIGGNTDIALGSATVTIHDNDTQTAAYPTHPAYRFYDTFSGGHFYTVSAVERDSILAHIPSYTYEGEGFKTLDAQTPGADAVWRFYNPVNGEHFFTISTVERDIIRANLPDFQFEGIGFHASDTAEAGMTAVFRFYDTFSNSHFFTTDAHERDVVMQSLPTYHFEGIAFYVPTADTVIA